MDQRIQHSFVNKPFYKSYRKCIGCRKRNIFRQIAKCSSCKIYCHQRCMQSDNNACCSPKHVEPKAQVTVLDLKTTVSRSSENDLDLNTVLWPEDDNQDLCQAESDVVADRPDNNIDVSCTESFNSAERRPCTPDDDDPGTGMGLQDENFEVINDQLLPDVDLYAKDAKPSDDGPPADECGTALAKEEVLADEDMSIPSDDGPPADECGTALAKEEVLADEDMSTPSDDGTPADEISTVLANDKVHTKSIQGCCAFKLASHHLSCTETEVGENQNDDDGDQKNKCCNSSTEKNQRRDDGDRKEDVPGENKLD